MECPVITHNFITYFLWRPPVDSHTFTTCKRRKLLSRHDPIYKNPKKKHKMLFMHDTKIEVMPLSFLWLLDFFVRPDNHFGHDSSDFPNVKSFFDLRIFAAEECTMIWGWCPLCRMVTVPTTMSSGSDFSSPQWRTLKYLFLPSIEKTRLALIETSDYFME